MGEDTRATTPADHYDVTVIGAGTAGTTKATLLRAAGLEVATQCLLMAESGRPGP